MGSAADRPVHLQVCADIPVGSQVIRGISGGQKKRVTTGEMLVGPQKVLFMVRPTAQSQAAARSYASCAP